MALSLPLQARAMRLQNVHRVGGMLHRGLGAAHGGLPSPYDLLKEGWCYPPAYARLCLSIRPSRVPARPFLLQGCLASAFCPLCSKPSVPKPIIGVWGQVCIEAVMARSWLVSATS